VTPGQRNAAWLAAAVVAAAAAGCVLLILTLHPGSAAGLTGVVLAADSDPHKQAPIGEAEITASGRWGAASAKSDVSGMFRVPLPRQWRSEQMTVSVRRAGYQPVALTVSDAAELLVVRMQSSAPTPTAIEKRAETVIANVRIRYSGKGTRTTNIGSVAKTFEVSNTGNVPCREAPPCSPDGRWKASLGSYSLDAEEGNELRSIRLSCIAGPCPFTRVEEQNTTQNGRILKISVLNWSDTATFLLEAEVPQTRITDVVRQSYPAIFGSTLSFTLPPEAEGPTLEAEMNGNDIVFPMGPDLIVSWAKCTESSSAGQNLYRCELKAGYRFK
jgi:hypothetical protein